MIENDAKSDLLTGMIKLNTFNFYRKYILKLVLPKDSIDLAYLAKESIFQEIENTLICPLFQDLTASKRMVRLFPQSDTFYLIHVSLWHSSVQFLTCFFKSRPNQIFL